MTRLRFTLVLTLAASLAGAHARGKWRRGDGQPARAGQCRQPRALRRSNVPRRSQDRGRRQLNHRKGSLPAGRRAVSPMGLREWLGN